MKRILLFLFLLSPLAFLAQTSTTGRFINGPAPSRPKCNAVTTNNGNANPGDVYNDTDDANVYECTAGTWAGLGGSGSPASPQNVLQKNSSGLFGASTGMNPYVDIRSYGARAIDIRSIPSTTATIKASSSTAILAAPGTFVNGDYVVIYGAGASCSLNTPSAPTVTPSINRGPTGTGLVANALAGSTSYAYEIVARDKQGCYTSASSSGSTRTGTSSLGAQSVAISTLSKSNNTVTVKTSSAHGLSTNAWVDIVNTSDSPDFGGWYQVTVTDGTHFTYTTPSDTRLGSAASAAGGTVYYWYANHVAWSAVSGAWEYYIYGRTGGSLILIGVSRPEGANTDCTFDDFGPTMMNTNNVFPVYVPTSPPSVGIGDPLVTKIISGAGTKTLMFANAASTSVRSRIITQDSGAAISAAAIAISKAGGTGGTLYIPATGNVFGAFVVNSFVALPQSISISQAGNLLLNETIQTGQYVQWFGNLAPQPPTATAFQLVTGAHISTNAAEPGIYVAAALQAKFSDLVFSANPNAKISLFLDNGQFISLDNDSFLNGNGNNSDYMGTGVYARGQALGNIEPLFLKNASFITSNPPTVGVTSTPPFICLYCGTTRIENVSLDTRGIFFNGGELDLRWLYQQQGITSPIILDGAVNNSSSVKISDVSLDTTAQPVVSVIGSGWVNLNLDNLNSGPSADSGGFLPVISGFPVVNVTGSGLYSTSTFPNTTKNATASVQDGIWSPSTPTTQAEQYHNEHFVLGTNYSLFSNASVPAAPTCSVASAGPPYTAAGTWYYAYAAVYPNGGTGQLSSPTAHACTANGTSQQITATIPAALSGASGYLLYCTSSPPYFVGATNTPITTLTFLDTSRTGNGPGNLPGGGPAGLQNGKSWATDFVLGSTSAPTGATNTTHLYMDNTANWPSFKPNGNKAYVIPGISSSIVNGHNLCADGTGGAYVDCLTTQNIASGTAILGTSAIATKTCATVVTTAATGVTATDAISFSFNAAPSDAYTTGLVIQSYVTPGNVNFLVCNPTADRLTPPAATLNWRVAR